MPHPPHLGRRLQQLIQRPLGHDAVPPEAYSANKWTQPGRADRHPRPGLPGGTVSGAAGSTV